MLQETNRGEIHNNTTTVSNKTLSTLLNQCYHQLKRDETMVSIRLWLWHCIRKNQRVWSQTFSTVCLVKHPGHTVKYIDRFLPETRIAKASHSAYQTETRPSSFLIAEEPPLPRFRLPHWTPTSSGGSSSRYRTAFSLLQHELWPSASEHIKKLNLKNNRYTRKPS